MSFFYSTNLTEKTLHTGIEPWAFVPTEKLTPQLREDKQSRQDWYRNTATAHYFYTGIEGANPNQRPSKDNPPKFLHAFHADYDVKIPAERVAEAVAAMKLKPSWVERSLGGNVRLVWTFPQPLAVETFDFACYVLDKAVKWLTLDMLPGLDESAFTDPSRLLCNGCAWHATGAGPIPAHDLQAFFVACGSDFRFKAADENNIPIDEIEKAIIAKYPGFTWPSEFVINSQGPTFWCPDSTTPLSAVVKPDGMFTFSAHAGKPFFSWSEIVGPDFVKQFSTNAIAKATADILWDGKHHWRKINGVYCSAEGKEMDNFFRVECKLASKPGKDGTSPIDHALNHIYNHGRIQGAAPLLFRPSGVIEFNGKRMLNTYVSKVMKPADELTPWGEAGKFPWLSMHFDNFFEPKFPQLDRFLAWFKAFYEAGLSLLPMPGQNTFFMGGVNIGKTLTNRGIIGKVVGGFADASAYLISGGGFNSELLEAPLWCVDDETMGESSSSQTNFQAMLKKTAANQTFQHNKKFEVGCTTEWTGRVVCTTNTDYVSSRALGPMDNSSMDKVNIFRCASMEGKIIFPNRHTLQDLIARELPYFLRWLLSWDPPAHVPRHVRYSYAAYHEGSLLDQAHQSNKVAPFKELLFETLTDHFKQNPEENEWRGTITQLIRLLCSNPLNESILRNLRLEQTSRYIEMIQRENLINCQVDTGPVKTRVWIFPRFGTAPALPAEPLTLPPQTANSEYTSNEQNS